MQKSSLNNSDPTSPSVKLVERLENRLQRDRRGNFDPDLSVKLGPGVYEEIMEAAARLTELEAEVETARALHHHQRDKRRHAHTTRNRAIDGLEYWRDRALAAESQLERVRAETWQDIETAPRDEWIIGYTSWGQHVGKFHEHIGPCEYIRDHHEFTDTDFDVFPRPTHWRQYPKDGPLPPSPAPGVK